MSFIPLGFLAASGSAAGDFQSIATVTLSTTSSSIDFTSIPSTYKHLQIRGVATSSTNPRMYIRYNGDTGSNYTYHNLWGQGSVVGATAGASQTENWIFENGMFATPSFVIDLLDYKDTNKFKTMRSLNGFDENGAGQLFLTSGLWRSTSAINAIKLFPSAGTFAANSTFALYGVK